MTTYSGLVKLTDQIIETAVDDHEHGLDGISLDNNLLTRLIKQLTSMERFAAVIGTCEDRMRHWIHAAGDAGGDLDLFGRARAALALSERLQRPGRSWRMDGATIEPA